MAVSPAVDATLRRTPMRCPHQAPGVCASCWSRQEAVERLARRLVSDARIGADVEVWEGSVEGRPATARAGQPFGLYAWERVGLVVAAVVAVLVLVQSLPPWALLLVLLTTMACLIRTQGRQLDALLRVVGGFVSGRPTRTG